MPTKIYEPNAGDQRVVADQPDWHLTEPWNPQNINAIEDPNGASTSRRITSYPSPIGQIFFYQDAFEKWTANVENNPASEFDTFYKAVSDVLDVFELLFNYDHFTQKLTLGTWNRNQIQGLQGSTHQGHRILGSSLATFLLDKDHPTLSQISEIFLVRYEGKLIAGSSPFTGFFLPPSLPESLEILVPGTKDQYYFQQARSLSERNPKFKAYMYRLAFILKGQSARLYPNLTGYVHAQRTADDDGARLLGQFENPEEVYQAYNEVYDELQISSGRRIHLIEDPDTPIVLRKYQLKVEETCGFFLKSSRKPDTQVLALKSRPEGGIKEYLPGQPWNDTLVVPHYPQESILENRTLPGTEIQHPWVTVGDFLEECLVKVPYSLDDQGFFTGSHEENFSYLLPVKPLYFRFFTLEDLKQQLQISRTRSGIRVELTLPIQSQARYNPQREENLRFAREYTEAPDSPTLYSLQHSERGIGPIISYDLGIMIFPFFKVISRTTTDQAKLNSFYKVGIVDDGASENRRTAANLSFFRIEGGSLSDSAGQLIQIPRDENVRKEERNILNEDTTGSTYYEVKDHIFDFLQVEATAYTGLTVRALVIPNWPQKELGSSTFKVSVDLGTTNTHVSLMQEGIPIPTPLRFMEETGPKLIGRLDKVASTSGNGQSIKLTEKYDSRGADSDSFIDEIINKQRYEFIPSILGGDYRFPLRTALAIKKGLEGNAQNYHAWGNNNIAFALNQRFPAQTSWNVATNLKWNDREESKAQLEAFLAQLLYLIKARIIIEGGNPRNTKLYWFFPLSMSRIRRGMLEVIWKEKSQLILGMEPKEVKGVSESESPYYALAKDGQMKGTNSLLTDIGGGTTDILIIAPPQSGNSAQNRMQKSNSFFFAGNTVFGCPNVNREDHVKKDNGFTRTFRPIIEKKITDLIDSSSTNISRYREMQQTLEWYFKEDTYMSAEDIVSFFFSQKEFEFANSLSQNPAFKQVFLFFFAALYYHCAQIYHERDLQHPTDIYFSGNGSKMLKLISPRYEDIALVIEEIFKHVMNLEKRERIKLHLANDPKESTSIGVLYRDVELKIEEGVDDTFDQPIIGETFSWEASSSTKEIPTYHTLRNAQFDVEKSAYFDLLDLYFKLYQDVGFTKLFEIRTPDAKALKEELKDRFRANQQNLYQKWIQKKASMGGLSDRIDETIFFVAVTDGLQLLIDKAAQQFSQS